METEGTLSGAWDRHLAWEFAAKSADEAPATMSAEPYVNMVPLMIGARGRAELHDFYANHPIREREEPPAPGAAWGTLTRASNIGPRRGAARASVKPIVKGFSHAIRSHR
jgi:hypothetical protein